MKKFLILVASVLIALSLTSCFDFVQSISLEEEDYHIKKRVSFSKQFLALALSGQDDQAISLNEFETRFDQLAENVGGESFHTPSESGITNLMIINKNTEDEVELANIPRTDGTKIIIPVIDMTNIAEDAQKDWDSLTAAYFFLSTAEYLLVLEKEVVPYISYAYFIEQASNNQYFVDVMDNGTNYLIEIPVMLLFEHPDTISPLILETTPKKIEPKTSTPPEEESTELVEETTEPPVKKVMPGNGPFGLEQGMTYEDILSMGEGVQLRHLDDDRYWIVPPKKHPSFEQYEVRLNENHGLYYIKAIGTTIEASDYGTELKQEFHNILDPLEKKYGKFKMIDNLASDFILSSEQYWMYALRHGARTYQAHWDAPGDSTKYNGIKEIWLGIEAKNSFSDEGYIWIEYTFNNADKAQETFDDIL